MPSVNNTPIDLPWRAELGPVMAELDRLLSGRLQRNSLLVARRILVMVQGGQNPIPEEIVSAVRRNDSPQGGWIGFDRAKWLGYVPPVVSALRSDNPMDVTRLF
jgi:hypothetical protein